MTQNRLNDRSSGLYSICMHTQGKEGRGKGHGWGGEARRGPQAGKKRINGKRRNHNFLFLGRLGGESGLRGGRGEG